MLDCKYSCSSAHKATSMKNMSACFMNGKKQQLVLEIASKAES